MCDEIDLANMRKAALTRRQFGAVGALAALSACTTATNAGEGSLLETTVAIPAADGTIDAFFVHPVEGRHSGVLFWPDGIGLRDAIKLMARRLAGAGYAVLVPNHYYRGEAAPQFADFATFQSEGGMKKIGPWIGQLTPAAVTGDARALIEWLDARPVVASERGIGTQGYCLGGGLAIRTAAAVPSRVRAVASFHGGGLVGEEDTAPVNLLDDTEAEFLIAIARNDDTRAPTDKDRLREAAQAASVAAEIEVYDGDHGWTIPDFPIYMEAEAERAWSRLLALYERTL